MTPSEIKAFARRVNTDRALAGKQVAIKNADGLYLCRTEPDGDLGWATERSMAFIYDYTKDKVGDQLEQVERQFGAKWEAEEIV